MTLRLIFIPVVDICVLETQAHSNMTFKNAAIINSGIILYPYGKMILVHR